MPPPERTLDIRPRTTGQILDDAWRLALADAPLLLTLSSLFSVPVFVSLLFLLTRPVPASWIQQCLLPATVALVVPLTGLGSGACQELLRRRVEGQPVTLHGCLAAALRRGAAHAAGRGIVLLGTALGCLFLILPGLALWVSTATLHSALALGSQGLSAAFGDAARDARRQPTQAAAVVLHRLPLLLLVVINLHLLIEVSLWVAGNLAGLETGLADLVLSPTNPIYLLTLFALGWLFLSPYFEAANYLLHLDCRVRFDGLDLRHRVRSLFPTTNGTPVSVFLLALGCLFCLGPTAWAEDERYTEVRAAREEVQQVIKEIKTVQPYPGSANYQTRLRRVAGNLKRAMGGPVNNYRWLDDPIDGLAAHSREGALEVLGELDHQLALVEDSYAPPPEEENGPRRSAAEIKALLPEYKDNKKDEPKPREQTKDDEEKRPVRHQASDETTGRGNGLVAPQTGSGLTQGGWMILGGILLAVLVLAVVLAWRQRASSPATPVPVAESSPLAPNAMGMNLEQLVPADLWHKAEELARQGRYLEGVRFLYLAVLSALHHARLIRYERNAHQWRIPPSASHSGQRRRRGRAVHPANAAF